MDQPLVGDGSSRGYVPPGPDGPILFLSADAVREQGGHPFVVIVKTREELIQWLGNPSVRPQWLQVEGLLRDPDAWTSAAHGALRAGSGRTSERSNEDDHCSRSSLERGDPAKSESQSLKSGRVSRHSFATFWINPLSILLKLAAVRRKIRAPRTGDRPVPNPQNTVQVRPAGPERLIWIPTSSTPMRSCKSSS